MGLKIYTTSFLITLISTAFSACQPMKSMLNGLRFEGPEPVPLTLDEKEQKCIENKQSVSLTIDELNTIVYRISHRKNELFPEMASPTLKAIRRKKGRYGDFIYELEARNVFTGDPIDMNNKDTNLDPTHNRKVVCVGGFRDGHSNLDSIIRKLPPEIIEFLQVKITAPPNTNMGTLIDLPAAIELDRTLVALRHKLPTWANQTPSAVTLPEGRQNSAAAYVHQFLLSGGLPQSTSGWMFYHDLLVHNLHSILVPPVIYNYFRGLVFEATQFARFVRTTTPNGELLSDKIFLSVADAIDAWSVFYLHFLEKPELNQLLKEFSRPSEKLIQSSKNKSDIDQDRIMNLGKGIHSTLSTALTHPDILAMISSNRGDFKVAEFEIKPLLEEYSVRYPEKKNLTGLTLPRKKFSDELPSEIETGTEFVTHLERLIAASRSILNEGKRSAH